LPDNKKAVDGDILYSVVGSFGKPVYVENLGKFVFQRHIAIIKPANGIDGRYLYYAMLNPDFFIQADRYAVGAAQRTLSLESLRSLEINLPDIKHQIKVADLLSKIDRKIKINNRINDNLPYQSTMMA
jgi:type I restriction enzyme S subunit